MKRKFFYVLTMLASVSLVHCSSYEKKLSSDGSSSSGDSDPGLGAVSPIDLSAYCTATVSKDVVVKFTDRDWFTVKSGEKLTQINVSFAGSTKMLRFTKSGYAYEVSELTSSDFTSDCAGGSEGTQELVALADVSIYSDPELTSKVCSFTKGQAVVSSSFGTSLAKTTTDGYVYQILGDAFGSGCTSGSGKYYANFPKITINEIGKTPTLFALLRKKN
jgi:hypothetical protein